MPTEPTEMPQETPRDLFDGLFVEAVFFDDRGAEARRKTLSLRSLLARYGQHHREAAATGRPSSR